MMSGHPRGSDGSEEEHTVRRFLIHPAAPGWQLTGHFVLSHQVHTAGIATVHPPKRPRPTGMDRGGKDRSQGSEGLPRGISPPVSCSSQVGARVGGRRGAGKAIEWLNLQILCPHLSSVF